MKEGPYVLCSVTDPGEHPSRGVSAMRPLLIAGSGTPHAPARGETVLARLAREVAHQQPHRPVFSATLAHDTRLSSIAAELEHPIVFPHFVADCEEVAEELPRRLAAAGFTDWVTTTPFGLSRDLRPRALLELKAAMLKHGLPKSETTLILAVDCGPRDTRKARAAKEFARTMTASRLFRTVVVGFLRDVRFLQNASGQLGQVMVVPFMAEDRPGFEEEIMAALAPFGAIGPILKPIGMWSAVPALISRAVRAHVVHAAPDGVALSQG